jgi:hypothetical protein
MILSRLGFGVMRPAPPRSRHVRSGELGGPFVDEAS